MKRLFAAMVALMVAVPVVALADGAADWDKKCASCHGKDGKGKTKMGEKMKAKDYSDAKVQDAMTDEAAVKATTDGVKEVKMPGFKDKMKPEEITAVIAHMRTFKGK
jgi:mono/diheme cytochrome c family protein